VAASYRAPEVVERERRLAAELVRREGLAPPVDVRALVERRAKVTTERIPAHCDAVVVGIQRTGTEPEVILQAASSPQRQRFTLGHELGHLVLPWHLGTLACTVDTSDVAGEYLHSVGESEANRFAAELLLPEGWLRGLFGQSDRLSDLAQRLQEADVSAHVACLQLTRVLQPGWLFAILDDDSHVIMSGRSRGTDLSAPRRLEELPGSFDRFCDEGYEVSHGPRTVRWWHLGGEVAAEFPSDDRRSTEVLRELTRRHSRTEADAARLFNRINGAMGYAYGRIATDQPTDAQLLGWLRSRFAGRDLPEELLADDDLDRYLLRRVFELRDKPKKLKS
jgi:hypothetical protein